ncbi:hypothetical protein AB0M46_00295 [Dactylosporangium sp. NPDC051485]|uniref:hypothetical protein n=1 Tax=Dactylosporangium sp. NPDC051485 TaxID=3154846 RepID=UPI00343B2D80
MANEADPATGDAQRPKPTRSHDGPRDAAAVLLDAAAVLLDAAIICIHRRYPDADMAYVDHPGGDDGPRDRVILWDLAGAGGRLWPDEAGEVFQGDDEPGERLWLGDRDGDPYAELAEINRLLTAVFRKCGSDLFEPGELGGGWYLPLAHG